MAFAGEIGADVELKNVGPDLEALFSESATRFVLEVAPAQIAAVPALFAGMPLTTIGKTVKEKRLRIAGQCGEWLIWSPLEPLKEAWQKTLRW